LSLIHKRVLRVVALLAAYTVVLTLSLLLALFLRFDFEVPDSFWQRFWYTCPWLVILKLAMLYLFGQFRSLLTFFSLPDVKNIGLAMGISAGCAIGAWWIMGGEYVVPRGVIVTDLLISFVGLASLRSVMRIYREGLLLPESYGQGSGHKRTLILGAGSSGATLFCEIRSKPGLGMNVVGFVDDDRSKIGSSIHGRPIYGPIDDLASIVETLDISKAVIAMPGAKPALVRQIVEILNQKGVEADILPSVVQLLHREVTVSHLRHVEPEDLLGRSPVALNEDGIAQLIAGKCVLVTGAGGSIGGELCRQIAEHSPARLVLAERSEPALFTMEQELRERLPYVEIVPLASSITQEGRMEEIFTRYRPQLVFHAAAHKHVPLMEAQPCEALFNNAYGTMLVARLATMHRAEKFVLVSTDKAVNPTNVMGATKRLAELVIAELQQAGGATSFSAVRFGNVLGSSGSVIPVFRKQISAGGPVKVTHPDITRYFMSIPEAVGLVLQCAFQSKGGEIFVLDMGEPMRIVDLAKQMIELSGMKPGEDVGIEFIGLRPGEKLFEEAIHKDENVEPTSHPKILALRNPNGVGDHGIIADLEKLAKDLPGMEASDLKAWMASRIPEYKIWKG